MIRPLSLAFSGRAFFRLAVLSVVLILVLAFQNCTSAIDFSTDTALLKSQQNGSGYEGKLYVHKDLCDGTSFEVASAIIDYGGSGGLWLTRENCQDLKEWKPVENSSVQRSRHDETILGHNLLAYDLAFLNSETAKTTTAFCVSSVALQPIESKVWRPAGQTTYFASVYDQSSNITGEMPLMPTQVSSVQSTLYQSQPEFLVSIEAYGEPAAGVWPLMRLRVDQKLQGESSVNSPTPSLYTFRTRQLPGVHDFEIKFMNDFGVPPLEDRNLILRSITIQTTDGSGSSTVVDLTKMTPDPVVADSYFFRQNGDLDVSKEIAVKQNVSFPNTNPDPNFMLTTSPGFQGSSLRYLPRAATAPVSTPATCYLQASP